MSETGLENLRVALLKWAIRDYSNAKRVLLSRGRAGGVKSRNAADKIDECKRFFLSEWFTALYDFDGKRLIDTLDRKIERSIETEVTV